MVMDADVPVVESGGKADFQYGNVASSLYPATKVDRVLHDGDEVKLGEARPPSIAFGRAIRSSRIEPRASSCRGTLSFWKS
jgi:hypothetical protein